MMLRHRLSTVAQVISFALASSVFSGNAAWLDFDSLPTSGAITSLPAELQVLPYVASHTNFIKKTDAINSLYYWHESDVYIYGNGLSLNGPAGQYGPEHTVSIVASSPGEMPAAIFGDDLTIRTQSRVAANNGNGVSGLYLHPLQQPDLPLFLLTGDRTQIFIDGDDGNGIHVEQSTSGRGTAFFRTGDELYIETTGDRDYGIYVSSNEAVGSGTSDVTVGNRARIITRGLVGSAVYALRANSTINIGDDAQIETFGKSSLGVSANSSARINFGNNATIITNANSTDVVYATTSSSISLGENAHIVAKGPSSRGVYAYNNGVINLGQRADVLMSSDAKDSVSYYGPIGISAANRGTVNLAGDTTVTMSSDASINSYALSAETGGVIDGSAGGKYLITGDIIYAGSMAASGTSPQRNSAISLKMTEGSIWNGASYTENYGPGMPSFALALSNATWNMNNSSTLTSLSLNSGSSVNFSHADDSWRTLTITGDYVGNGGKIRLNTVLNDDTSDTDKLIVNGNTSGNTFVAVNNIGGLGAATVQGIEVVRVGGNSEGVFEKEARIVAGGYDYSLVKKGNNWYLTSEAIPDPVIPEEPVDPVPPEPEDPVDPVVPVKPEQPVAPTQPLSPSAHRPEFGSYLANNIAGNTLFMTRLHDRLGEAQYTDALTGEKKVTSLWLRNVGNHLSFKDGSGQLKTQSNSYVLQLGGDLAQWSTDGLDRWHIGAMAGYANSKNRTTSALNNHYSRGQIEGYSVGLYGTWYANQEDKSGGYVDSWVLYNWFDNTVNGQYQAVEEYRSKGITASIEAGYSQKVGGTDALSYWIQPKAQAVWMDVQADDHREDNGTYVQADKNGNLMTSLGIRAYMSRSFESETNDSYGYQPFIEANWVHNSHSQSVKMGSESNEIQGLRDAAELKVGVEGQITPRLNVWGNVAQKIGSAGYSETQGTLGVKYLF